MAARDTELTIIHQGDTASLRLGCNPTDEEGHEEPETEVIAAYPLSVETTWNEEAKNPMHWNESRKWTIILLVAFSTFFAQMSYTAFQPALPKIMDNLQVSSNRGPLSTLAVSISVLGSVFGPLLIGPVSEQKGRRIILLVSYPMLLISLAASGASVNIAMFLVFRALGGFPITALTLIGNGIVADLLPVERRGFGLSVVQIAPSLVCSTLCLTSCPLIGGYITQYVGWKWIFWIYSIAIGACGIAVALIYRETYSPVLERRFRAASQTYYLTTSTQPNVASTTPFRTAFSRPFRFMRTPVVIYATFVCSIANTYLVFALATLGTTFQEHYGFTVSQSGLAYLGMTAGFVISQATAGSLSDGYVRRKTRDGVTRAKPEHRLPFLMLGAVLLPAGFIMYGWGLQYRAHFLIPIIGSSLISLGVMYNFAPVQMYVIDSFTLFAVSATGAVGVVRSIVTTVFPLAGDSLYRRLDYGWGNSLLAFIALTGFPMAVIFCKYGERWRLRYPPKL